MYNNVIPIVMGYLNYSSVGVGCGENTIYVKSCVQPHFLATIESQ